MVSMIKRWFRHMKISTEILLVSMLLVFLISLTFMIINWLNLATVEREVNRQLNTISTSLRSFLGFTTGITKSTVLLKLNNLHIHNMMVGSMIYFTTLFRSFKVTTNTIGCREYPYTPSQNITSESILGELTGLYVADGRFSTGYIWANANAIPDISIFAQINAQWGFNLDVIEANFKTMGEIDPTLHLGYLVAMINFKQTSPGVYNWHGAFGVYPGSCAAIDYHRPRICKLQ